MIRTIGVYHIGIPVDDLDRAEDFYTKILGMQGGGRGGEGGARLARRMQLLVVALGIKKVDCAPARSNYRPFMVEAAALEKLHGLIKRLGRDFEGLVRNPVFF